MNLYDLINRLMAWIPGCSPDVPQSWKQAALQGVTCIIRWSVFALSVYLIYRLAL